MFNKKTIILLSIAIIALTGCQTQTSTTSTQTQDGDTQSQSSETSINSAGTYTFTGETSPITVNASEDDEVNIILDNVSISSSTESPINIIQAKQVNITLAQNSTNTIQDSRDPQSTNQEAQDFPNAAIYSETDLTIQGQSNSSLTVEASLNDGITSKDDLIIQDANITVNSYDDGIRGKDLLSILDSTITVDSEGDSLKADNDSDIEKGFIQLENSTITINSGDDAIHAETQIDILSGDIDIQSSYEGIEAKVINIKGGDIIVNSDDDALNISGEATSATTTTQTMPTQTGRPMGGGMEVLEGGMLTISGGTVTINAEGDGFDSNGNAQMTGGTLIINGPTASNNGAIDVNGTFNVSGGTIIAIGSSGMAETPSETSTQIALQVNFDTQQSAGTNVTILDSNNQEILNYDSVKTFQSVTFTSSDLQLGETYTINLNGTQYTQLTLSDTITKYGQSSQMGRGGRFDPSQTPPQDLPLQN